MKTVLTFLLVVLLLDACRGFPSTPTDDSPAPDEPVKSNEPGAGKPVPQPYLPQPGDMALTRGAVFIDSIDLLVMESYPVQIMLALKGSLPTPCNQLRVAANPPDEQDQIHVEVYSVADPGIMCAQVLEPFEANIGLGSFPSGHYSIWINGELIGEFDS